MLKTSIETQQGFSDWQSLVGKIMESYKGELPSSYTSTTKGTNYQLDFLAIAEQLAKLQIAASQVFYDSQIDFVRSQFFFQNFSSFLFPKGSPKFDSDEEFREFLKKLLPLMTKNRILQDALRLLAENLSVVELPRHNVEVILEGFPKSFQVLQNIDVLMDILKPAHSLYQTIILFREDFSKFDSSVAFDVQISNYADFRYYCDGMFALQSSNGETLLNRHFFRDTTISFESVIPEASYLRILSGANEGIYQIKSKKKFLVETDLTPRNYVTTPSNLSGTLTIENNVIEDVTQNWALATEGEVLQILGGANAGFYRLQSLVPSGELVGISSVVSQKVTISPCLLELKAPMRFVATNQNYLVGLDIRGRKEVNSVIAEDASSYFL